MFKWLDKTTNFLLRFVYDSLKVFLLFIMVIRAFDNTFAIEGIFWIHHCYTFDQCSCELLSV